jgi:hypothetical protein
MKVTHVDYGCRALSLWGKPAEEQAKNLKILNQAALKIWES